MIYFSHTMSGNAINLTGMRFGRLLAVKRRGTTKDNHVAWLCKCDCGASVVVGSNSLRKQIKGTRSCGCYRREVSRLPKLGLRGASWNRGLRYSHPNHDGTERIYKQKHAWSRAAKLRFGDRCQNCGWNKAPCDVHHKIPRKRGGENTMSNAIVLCPNCHREQHRGNT